MLLSGISLGNLLRILLSVILGSSILVSLVVGARVRVTVIIIVLLYHKLYNEASRSLITLSCSS
jgi:hypothetical protein